MAKRAREGADDGFSRAIEDFLRYAPTYGVEPSSLQIEQIRIFVRDLLRWNEKVNLTAAKDPGEVLIRHVLDSLVPLAYLPGVQKLMDVGTGGGFPGIPLKIFRPEWPVVLVEARRKKAAFNQLVVDGLGLQRTEVLWARLGDEDLENRFKKNPFDTIITRATFSGGRMLGPANRLLRPGGTILLMKGALDKGQQGKLKEEAYEQGRKVVRITTYRLPGSKRTKNLVLIR